MRRTYVWFLVAVLLLVGCSTPTPPAVTPSPTVNRTTAPDIDYRQALAALSTYKARASMDVYPAPETGLAKAHLEVEVDAVNAPERARRTVIRGLRSMAKPEDRRKTADVLKLISVGGDLYVSTGTTWLKTPAQNDPEQGILDPGKLVPNPNALTLVEDDVEVNGIRTRHYRFDTADALAYLGEEERAQVTSVQGDVWLASEGHYIVRYRASMDGKGFQFDFSPTPFPGRVEVAYDVYAPNEPLTIEAPRQALGNAPDKQEDKPVVLDGFDGKTFPLPADADVAMSTHQVVIFNTGFSVEEAARFFAQALDEMGWQQKEHVQTSNGTVKDVWTRGGYVLHLTIVPDKKMEGVTHVTVGVNPAR